MVEQVSQCQANIIVSTVRGSWLGQDLLRLGGAFVLTQLPLFIHQAIVLVHSSGKCSSSFFRRLLLFSIEHALHKGSPGC